MKSASNIDLMRLELLNARIQNLTSAPTTPGPGQVYFNTQDNKLYTYNGTKWVDSTSAESGVLHKAILTGTPIVKTAVTKTAGNAIDDAFRVESSTKESLFQVKTNGDTVIGGVLTVNGTGESSFAGNVNIGGNLHVDGTITGGTQVDLGKDLVVTGNLNVKGNTTLGDNATEDTVDIMGVTTINSKMNKATGSSVIPAFNVLSKDKLPLFQVMENGDANIAGVLTVKAINGGAGATGPSMELAGDTVVENLLVQKNLTVNGITKLGDNAGQDSTLIKGYTEIVSKAAKTTGSAVIPSFNVKDSVGESLFQVMENGDTVIAGVLKVKGTGESEFAGNVKIGGNLTVEGDATVKGVMKGNDFNIKGNLVVDGNTLLGDNAVQDTTTIKGKTTIFSGATKGAGLASTNAFEVLASDSSPLFEVRQNGDAIIGNNLKVEQGAIVAANMSGTDLTLKGNLNVEGNTTLGNEATDRINVVGKASFTQDVSMNSKVISDLADPRQPQDAATKNYVDAVKTGLDMKDAVRVATTVNIALSGLQTIDGVSVVKGDRVLVKNQTAAKDNGIYIVNTLAWTRAEDADDQGTEEVKSGLYTFVQDGTNNANSGWVLSTLNPITVGTTGLDFVQFSGAGSFDAGNGLVKIGNRIDVVGTPNRITASENAIDIASNYVGQSSITTLGSVTTGTWNATTIAITKGGTGATTVAGARSNLGATGKYSEYIGDGTKSSISVTHNLGSQDVIVSVRDKVTNAVVLVDVEHTTANAIKVNFGFAPAVDAYRVVVIG